MAGYIKYSSSILLDIHFPVIFIIGRNWIKKGWDEITRLNHLSGCEFWLLIYDKLWLLTIKNPVNETISRV
jgi:hypothetical protein